MPEILTESFCERCGTRYTFESGARTPRPLTGIKVLTQGLKNFVMSDDTSMDEAMAAARSDAERKATTQQLDAFHKTFNFCMTCRQYTCANCWNETEAKCLTCAPHLGREIMPAPFPTLEASAGIAPLEAGPAGHVHEGAASFESAPTAWPVLDGMPTAEEPAQEAVQEPIEEIDLGARLRELALDGDGAATTDGGTAVSPEEPVAEERTETPVEAAADAGVPTQWPEEVEPPVAVEEQVTAEEPVAAEEPAAAEIAAAEPVTDEAIATDEAVDADDPMAAARQQTASLLARFRPGQSLDAALEEFERGEAAAEADRDIASAPETVPAEAEARPEPEPVAAEPEPEPVAAEEPIAAEPEPVAAAESEPAPSGRPADDQIEQPTWPVSAPQPAADVPRPHRRDEEPALPAAARAAPPAEPPAAPQWPAQPQWPSQTQWPAAGTAAPDATFLGRPVVPSGGIDALWAASSGEVLGQPLTGPEPARTQPAPVGVRPCVSCGLSLSSTARFCRRCGTPQGPA